MAKAAEKTIIGEKFGFLVVEKPAERKNGKRYWQCRCRCGAMRIVQESHLLTGHTKSCGCLRREAAANRAANLCGKRFGRALNLTQIQLYVMVVVVKKMGQHYLVHCVKHENV